MYPNHIPTYVEVISCHSNQFILFISGEVGYYHMQYLYGWAKCPILPRINQLHDSIGLTLIKGSYSWLDNEHTGDHIQLKRPASYLALHTIHAGHHLYAQKNSTFNILVSSMCDIVDEGGDLATSGTDRSEQSTPAAF